MARPPAWAAALAACAVTLAACAVALAACAPALPPEPSTLALAGPPPDAREGGESAPRRPAERVGAAHDAVDLAPDEPLREGLLRFEGTLLPTKGGFSVRGVIVDDALLTEALRGKAPEPADLLGAKLRLTATLVRRGSEASRAEDPTLQMRGGVWYAVDQLHEAEAIAPPEQIEGELQRSKGFYAVGGKLIERRNVQWALRGFDEKRVGQRVRLHGQSRTVACKPEAQCLLGGSLPLFDVGRAEWLDPAP